MTVRYPIAWVVVLTFCFFRSASAQYQWLVLNTKPASVSRINAATHELTGDVPLPGTPGYALLSRSGAFLYVLLDGAFDLSGKPHNEASRLAVVDVQAMSIVTTIELGWRAHQVAMTPNGEYIVSRSAGRPQQKNSDEIPPQIVIIGTSSNRLVTKWQCPRKDVAFRERLDSVDVVNALALPSHC